MSTIKRPPIVVVMGHIDHGKSTLLDTIRHTNIVDTEAGGITQHLSAYSVTYESQEHGAYPLTFLDTPGHASFQKMRLRGADVADIAILIVSAEDGVMPQTLEALTAIKEAGIPYIIAINKIDKPNADLVRTQTSLIEHEIYIEGMGGDIPWVGISAKTGTGIDELLDTVILSAELTEITGDPETTTEGTVIEGHVDNKRGIAATLIVKNGTLTTGSFVVSEHVFAPVRIMEDMYGKLTKEATLSMPVGLIGWNEIPRAGAHFTVVATKKEAEQSIEAYKEVQTTQKHTHNTMSGKPIIPILIKADTLGSIEAIAHEVELLKNDRVDLRIIDSAIGEISATDIQNISATEHAIVIGFNTKIDRHAEELAERLTVAVGSFSIIYDLSKWLAERIEERIPREKREETIGSAKILKRFSTQKNSHVIGGRVQNGELSVGSSVHIDRNDIRIGEGIIRSLQQQKSSTDRVTDGEFGMVIDSKTDVTEGDTLTTYKFVIV